MSSPSYFPLLSPSYFPLLFPPPFPPPFSAPNFPLVPLILLSPFPHFLPPHWHDSIRQFPLHRLFQYHQHLFFFTITMEDFFPRFFICHSFLLPHVRPIPSYILSPYPSPILSSPSPPFFPPFTSSFFLLLLLTHPAPPFPHPFSSSSF